MKRTQILATLAFAFMLGAAVPLVIEQIGAAADVSAAEQDQTETSTTPSTETQADDSAAASSTTVNTVDDFKSAVNNPSISKITLGATLDGVDVDIDRDMNAPLVIDLAGFEIKGGSVTSVKVSHGNVRFTGAGIISSASRSALTVRGSEEDTGSNYVTVTVDKGVLLTSTNVYGLLVSPYDANAKKFGSYGVKVVMNGEITGAFGMHVNGSINDEANRPQITIGDDAKITVNGKDTSTPIYAAGTADWTIGAATLEGKTAVGIRSGTFTFNDTSVNIDGPMQDNPAPLANGMNVTGVAIQIEHHTAYADNVDITINGGTYTSANGDVFYEYGEVTNPKARTTGTTTVADINITGGTFTAGADREIFGGDLGNSEDADIEISGGKFLIGTEPATDEIASFLSDDYQINEDGTVASTEPDDPNENPDENPEEKPSNPTPSRPSGSTTSPEAPEAPSDSKEPSDTTPDQKPSTGENIAPDTGLNQRRGVLTATNTILSLVCGAIGVIIMVCAQKVFSRRKALNTDEIEMEIDQQIAEIMDEPEEPVVERFVAEAIESEKPKVTPVDTFILQK